MKYLIIALLFLFAACKDGAPNPKPHAYPRIYYPVKTYQLFDTNAPFTFLYPGYAEVRHNNEDSPKHPFWYNINFFPADNGGNAMATLHLSYEEFNERPEFDNLFDDTRRLAYKHDIKAEEINEIEVHNASTHTTGIIYELSGNTATPLNFYISDGKKHFLRGALYFNSRTQIDSILPMVNFLKQDVIKTIETTKWK